MIKLTLSAVVLSLASQVLLAGEAGAAVKVNSARVMWAAFSCAVYAEISGEKKEYEKLFDLGYKAGRTFVDGVRNKTITEAEVKEAPIGVLWYMAGPTTDFIVGRIYEAATGDAYDKVVKEDSAGLPILDPYKWARDELKVMRAKNKYLSSNCTLVR